MRRKGGRDEETREGKGEMKREKKGRKR